MRMPFSFIQLSTTHPSIQPFIHVFPSTIAPLLVHSVVRITIDTNIGLYLLPMSSFIHCKYVPAGQGAHLSGEECPPPHVVLPAPHGVQAVASCVVE